MKLQPLCLLAICAAGFTLLGCGEGSSSTSSGPEGDPKPASSDSGTAAASDIKVEFVSWPETQKRAQEAGKVTVVDIWSTY